MDAVPLSAGYELHSPHTFAVLLSILYTVTKRVSTKYLDLVVHLVVLAILS